MTMTLDEALARIAALEREGAHITRAAKDWGCDDGDVVTFINLLALRVQALEPDNDKLTLERDGARLNYDKLLAEVAARVGAAEARVALEREGARRLTMTLDEAEARIAALEREGARLRDAAEAVLAQFQAITDHQHRLLVEGQTLDTASANWVEATLGLSMDFQPLIDALRPLEGGTMKGDEPLGRRSVTWQRAALRLGEELTTVGPDGYYNFSPETWLAWCLAARRKGKR